MAEAAARRRVTTARILPRLGLAVLVLLTGCGPHPRDTGPTPVPSGSSSRTLTVDGRSRAFRVYRPAALPTSARVPLVVMLHGGFGDGAEAERDSHWDTEADRHGFVVAYPDGLDRAWTVGGGCCGIPAATGVDDTAFVTAMVTALTGVLPIDPARVYATGISNGGMLTYRLACDTRLFAAIGPDSATLLGPCPNPAPVSVIHIHGTADHNIPYLGGRGDGFAHVDGPAVPDVAAAWRATDHCAAPVSTTAGAVTTSLADCPDGRAVELVTIEGAGHQWPGAVSHPVAQKLLPLDPPSTALDATDTLWQFFAAHPRR